jgi:hypothetical protein
MEHIRKLNKMRNQVKEELRHIPRGDLDQNMLRHAYWVGRMHSLGKKARKEISKEEVVIKAAKLIKKDNPNFCPKYDEKFFDEKLLRKAAKDDSNVKACFE